jgi:hypothetical protein
MIAAALPVAKLGDPASWALQELSQFCRSHLTKYFHQLMNLLTRLEGQGLHEDEVESVSKGEFFLRFFWYVLTFTFEFFSHGEHLERDA